MKVELFKRIIICILFIISAIFSVIGVVMLFIPLFFINLFNRILYEKIITYFIGTWESMAVFFIESLGTKLKVYSHMNELNENCIIIMNHKNRLDWFYFFMFSYYFQDLSNLKIIMKNELKHVPFGGWACQFGGYLFLLRDWKIDEIKLKKYLQYLKNIVSKIQLLIFVEGTNFCPECKQKSDNYAIKNNLPLYNYVLHPRTTGFSYIYETLTKPDYYISYIYDVTIAYIGDAYNELDLLLGNTFKEVHIYVQPFPTTIYHDEPNKIDMWLKERWNEKEKSLESFYTNGYFLSKPPLIQLPYKKNEYYKLFIYWLINILLIWMIYQYTILKYYFIITIISMIIISKYIGVDNIIINNLF